MKVLHRIGFTKDDFPDFTRYLTNNRILLPDTEQICSITISENSQHWPYIRDFVENNNLLCLSETVFSKKELFEADWLLVRSRWRFGYPQPQGNYDYEEITYTRVDQCAFCGVGLKQVRPFQIQKSPRWKNNHFFELNWIGDELFVDSFAKNILQESGITGVSFDEVRDIKRDQPFRDVFQLYIPHVLKEGLLSSTQAIAKTTKCMNCGRNKYLRSGIGMLEFEREIFEEAPDVVKSFESFGDGFYACRKILVRKKFYHTIASKEIGKQLVFEPVKLV